MTGEKPKFAELTLLRTTDGKRLNIIHTVATKWEDVATRLGISRNEIKFTRLRARHRDEEACHDIFRHWLQGGGCKPITWATLIECLEDTGFVEMSEMLRIVCNYKKVGH